MNILVTGAKGFVGRNLKAVLRRREDVALYEYDLEMAKELLEAGLRRAEVVFHLAGVNRPEREEEFFTGNTGSTEKICRRLRELGRRPKIVLSSSIQAELDNPYGVSKRKAEEVLRGVAEETGAECAVSFGRVYGRNGPAGSVQVYPPEV